MYKLDNNNKFQKPQKTPNGYNTKSYLQKIITLIRSITTIVIIIILITKLEKLYNNKDHINLTKSILRRLKERE
uniref:Uncharacterized protein n=1 Tax=Heterorhabditis bacteriophora TaxID=37862 RepID=A0A1I7WC99_HETBA